MFKPCKSTVQMDKIRLLVSKKKKTLERLSKLGIGNILILQRARSDAR